VKERTQLPADYSGKEIGGRYILKSLTGSGLLKQEIQMIEPVK
jgi:hypothetical protein